MLKLYHNIKLLIYNIDNINIPLLNTNNYIKKYK